MKNIKFLVPFFVLAVFLLLNAYKLSNNQKSVVNNSLSPTPFTQNSVLGEASGKCQATQVDASDPQSFLPDSNCTPGVVDNRVSQENISATICKGGYTQTVRPPVSYTNTLKRQQLEEYGYEDTNMKDYEEDHLISLELGGSPDDPKNLWPEPHPSFNEKDKVENYLHEKVCSGEITLTEAQKEISTNWYEIYKKM